MPTRKDFLSRLLRCLKPQIVPGVEILIRMCDPKYTLGDNRDTMLRSATAEYVSQTDDDDLVATDYVSSILPLLDGVDQIGFEVQLSMDGVRDPKRDYHTLKAGSWYDTDDAYYRDISHLQPMRRELALSVAMEGGHGEDRRWADRMRGKVKTEHYIPKILYFYLFRSGKQLALPCSKCKSLSTVKVEQGMWCNSCGHLFNQTENRKSCLWV